MSDDEVPPTGAHGRGAPAASSAVQRVDANPVRVHAWRSERAARDLATCATWAGEHGLHLVLEAQTTRHFAFLDSQLPPGTVDARHVDALAIATTDPTALVVTAGGHYWGTPLTRTRGWNAYAAQPRTWAVLVVSRLTGAYYGLHVYGANIECFVGGVQEEEIVGADATVVLVDGSVATVVRTTVGARLEDRGTTKYFPDLAAALRSIGKPVVRITASGFATASLARLVEQAGVLPDEALVLNGETWRRTPALERA